MTPGKYKIRGGTAEVLDGEIIIHNMKLIPISDKRTLQDVWKGDTYNLAIDELVRVGLISDNELMLSGQKTAELMRWLMDKNMVQPMNMAEAYRVLKNTFRLKFTSARNLQQAYIYKHDMVPYFEEIFSLLKNERF